MSYLLDISILHTKLQAPVFSREAYTTHETASTYLLQRRYVTWKTSPHLLCAPRRRIYRGGRRHQINMSVVVLITLSCRPLVLSGHKDYMKYQYHRYRCRHRHQFCRCVYARPNGYGRSTQLGTKWGCTTPALANLFLRVWTQDRVLKCCCTDSLTKLLKHGCHFSCILAMGLDQVYMEVRLLTGPLPALPEW
jgi:hypothetical protein